MLQKGDKLPAFKAPLATADGVSEFDSTAVVGKGPVVIAFYPAAFTGVCTKELCETRDSLKFFEEVNAQVFGFSTDTPFANAAFLKEQDLNFPLISDVSGEAAAQIWETQQVAMMPDRVKRGVLVVDTDGVVQYVWSTDNPGEWPGLEEVKSALKQ